MFGVLKLFSDADGGSVGAKIEQGNGSIPVDISFASTANEYHHGSNVLCIGEVFVHQHSSTITLNARIINSYPTFDVALYGKSQQKIQSFL